MKHCYVVGIMRFQDLGDAIEEAKNTLFTKLKLRDIKSTNFTMRATESRIIVKATYDDCSSSHGRSSRSVSIRRYEIKPTRNRKIAKEYAEFSL